MVNDKVMCPGTEYETGISWSDQKLFHCTTCERTFKTDRPHPEPSRNTQSHDRTMSMVWAYRKQEDPFVALFKAVAACEAPEGTQVDEVLAEFQERFDERFPNAR